MSVHVRQTRAPAKVAPEQAFLSKLAYEEFCWFNSEKYS